MFNVKIILDNDIKEIKVMDNKNLILALAENDIYIPADCGGKGVCGKCKVKLIEGKVNCEINESGYFNSCRCFVNNDITIKINTIEGKGITKAKEIEFEIKPTDGYGLAIDIGTTTVAYYLVDLKTANEIDSASDLNRQATYGSDVISRIDASKNGHLQSLQNSIVNQINQTIKYFCKKHNIDKIKKIVISGNTTMQHLVLGVDPTSMGVYPFEPIFINTKYTNEKMSGIMCDDITLLPSVSAYIGSDVVAGVLSGKMIERKGVSLLIDIGTNGEMVLNNNGKLIGCATAAGPAFEGANIEKGMAGIKHAIDHIYYKNDNLSYTTIDGEPLGICGSGLIDAIAVLIKSKNIDDTGFFTNKDNIKNSSIKGDRFYIADSVYLTQKDIREFQLAKSAIKSGVLTLLDVEKIRPSDVNAVLLAGGFGQFLDKENAIITGLIPKDFVNKIDSIGNASGLGAKMCLLNDDYVEKCEKLSTKIDIIELANSSIFMEYFIENMGFDLEN